MRAIHALIVFTLIYLSSQDFNFTVKNCTDYAAPNGKAAFSLDFCRATNFDTDVYAKCCFLKWEKDSRRKFNCVPVNAYDLADIDEKIKSLESKLGADIKSLDCKSSYLYGSLLLVIFLLL